MVAALLVRTVFLPAQASLAAPAGGLWNGECNMLTPAESQFALGLMLYGLAAASTFLFGYLAWRKIRPRRHRYRYHRDRNGHQKGVFGWE